MALRPPSTAVRPVTVASPFAGLARTVTPSAIPGTRFPGAVSQGQFVQTRVPVHLSRELLAQFPQGDLGGGKHHCLGQMAASALVFARELDVDVCQGFAALLSHRALRARSRGDRRTPRCRSSLAVPSGN